MNFFNENNEILANSVWSGDSTLSCEVYSAPVSSLQTEGLQLYQVLPNGIEKEPTHQSIEVHHIIENGLGSVVPTIQNSLVVELVK